MNVFQHRAALALAGFIFSATAVHADRVVLKTGEVFEGKILFSSDKEVAVRLHRGGVVSFRSSRIESVRHDGQPPLIQSSREPLPKPVPDVDLPGTPTLWPARQTSPAGETGALSLSERLGETTTRLDSGSEDDSDLLDDPFDGTSVGFRLYPPLGFVQVERETAAAVFEDPATKANLTVVSYESSDAVEAIKRRAQQAYTEQLEQFRVVRDEQVSDTVAETWRLEVRSVIQGEEIRQIQTFAGTAGRVVVLTYTCAEKDFGKFSPSFDASIESLTVLPPPETPEIDPSSGSEAERAPSRPSPQRSPSEAVMERLRLQLEG